MVSLSSISYLDLGAKHLCPDVEEESGSLG